MYQFFVATSVMGSCPTKAPDDPLDEAVDPVIEDEQVHAEEHRHQNHDHGRRVHLGLARPRDALQLVAHLTDKEAHAFEAAARSFPDRLKIYGHIHSRRFYGLPSKVLTSNCPKGSGRPGGNRT